VGEIPQGLPSFSIPRGFDHAESLIPTAVLITGVAILVLSYHLPLFNFFLLVHFQFHNLLISLLEN
jgi:hypothetical protein